MRMYLTLRSTGFMSPVVQSHRDTRGTGFPTNACYPFCTEMHPAPNPQLNVWEEWLILVF